MEMDNKMMPKNFLRTAIPDLPIILSIILVVFSTKYTITIFNRTAINMSGVPYSALSESIDVIEPAPAIIGKARGTMDELSEVPPLKISIPKIISMAKKNNTKDPAMANDSISTPNTPSIASPKNRNETSMINENKVVLNGYILFPLVLRLIIMGMEPIMSITANITINTEKISKKLRCIA
jgi:hypothetical protein